MERPIRIRTQPNDGNKSLKVKLEQSFDSLEILSLNITQEDLYQIFSADYGVIVGRVIANQGFGVPNAKVSVFIPLSEDETNPEIIGRYPYNSTTDRNNLGVRYNLLEDTQQGNCHTPVGSFPSKRKMLDNDVWIEVYDTYYKYTTTTNFAGDYMIYGVPLGNQTIHMDVDVSNIGFLSIKPYELMNQGYNSNLFDSNTTFKSSNDLESLVQIQSRDVGVNVIPFWGDEVENEIGINRVDFNISTNITPTAQFFGSTFSEQRNKGVYKRCTPRSRNGRNCEFTTGTGRVEYIRRISNDSNEVEYVNSNATEIDDNGNWAILIPMNLDPVVTDEFGNLIPSEDPTIGIPTTAMVRFRISMDEFRFGFRKRTAHYLVPNMYNRFQFGTETNDADFYTMRWKKAYTVANYIPRYQKNTNDESVYFTGIKRIGECESQTSFPFNRVDGNVNILYSVLCVIISAVGTIINFLNILLKVVIFNVVLRFICFVKHPFNSSKRGACRCSSCYNLSNYNNTTDNIPNEWDGTIDDFDNNTGNGIDDRLECSACYDASDGEPSYPFKDNENVTGDITTNTAGATNGIYTNVPSTSSGEGGDVLFTVNITAGVAISVVVTTQGTGYRAGDTVTIDGSDIGNGSNLTLTISASSLQTDIIIDGVTINCEDFEFSYCDGLCNTCDVSIIPLNCNGVEYTDGDEWAECVKEGLAESLGVIRYEFYNDWIIGSVYSYLFDYKIKLKKKGKNLEKFCDYDCDPSDSDDEHRKNRCREAHIIDKEDFNGGSSLIVDVDPPNGRGLIVEYNDFLYYSARHDVEINDPNAADLTVSEKGNLLFATNIIELGSVVTCDLDGESFVIDKLESTSYQTDEGTGTLLDVSNCGLPVTTNLNLKAIQTMSQAGIDILVAEAERISDLPLVVQGDDGEIYTVIGDPTNLPDYDNNVSDQTILILDRDGATLRQTLCESFDFYGTTGNYVSTEYPLGSVATGTMSSTGTTVIGVATLFTTEFTIGDYIKSNDGQVREITSIISDTELVVDTPFIPSLQNSIIYTISNYVLDEDGDVIEFSYDRCEGFDDIRDNGGEASGNMHPYYLFFGSQLGKTALDKLKKLYYDKCID